MDEMDNRVILGGAQQGIEVPFDAAVTGSASGESVSVGAGGRLDFAPNSGDRVMLPGTLSEFSASTSGNTLTLSRGDGTDVTLSVGAPVPLVFADGAATVDIGAGDSGPEITLGGVPVGADFDPAQVALDPAGADPNAGAGTGNRVILNGTAQTLEVPFNAEVTGTAAEETVRVRPGAQVAFDGNTGDRLEFARDLSALELSASGNELVVRDGEGGETRVRLNADVSLGFGDGGTMASVGIGEDGPEVRLGGLAVRSGFDPAQVGLDPNEAANFGDGDEGGGTGLPPVDQAEVASGTPGADNIDGDQNGATLSGGAGLDRFVFDSVMQNQQVTLDDFEAGEALRFEGGFTEGDLTVSNGTFGDDQLVLNINATEITLTNLDPADDGQIFSPASFTDVFGSQALDFGGSDGDGGSETQVALDALGGTPSGPETVDVGGGAFTLTDGLDAQSFTEVSNFGADDQITLTGVTADDVMIDVSSGNTNIEFDDGAGTVSNIQLKGVSGFFIDVATFNADSSLGDISFSGSGSNSTEPVETFEASAAIQIVDDPAFDGLQDEITDAVNAGFQQWIDVLAISQNVTLDIEVSATDTAALAQGGSSFSSGDVNAEGGVPSVFANKIITGNDSNGDAPDASIALSRMNLSELFPDEPQDNGINVENVMAHELGHALGFISLREQANSSIQTAWDVHVREGADGLEFTGPNAMMANGGAPVPLDDPGHLSEEVFDTALMTPIAEQGGGEEITDLEVAVLQDLGFAVDSLGGIA